MIYQIIAILILVTFYMFYFAKIIIQKKQSIKTNQMGIGNKSKKVLVIERIMSVATVLTCIIGVLSIFLGKRYPKVDCVPFLTTGVLIAEGVSKIFSSLSSSAIYLMSARVSRSLPSQLIIFSRPPLA